MDSSSKPVSLIIGAGSRLGFPLVTRYLEKNYKVVAASRNPVDLDNVQDAEWHKLDIRDFEACSTFISNMAEAHKGIDVITICSGYYPAETAFEQQQLEEMFLDIDITYKGPVAVSKAFVDANKPYQKGDIVFISSCAGYANAGGIERIVHSGNKAALNRFAEMLNDSIKPLGMRAFNIIPWQLSQETDDAKLTAQGAISYHGIAEIILDIIAYRGNAQACTIEVKPSFSKGA